MAGDIGQRNKNSIIGGFERMKDNAMLKALRAKFSQYPKLGDELISTGNRQLIEHNMYDDYWDDGGNGSGSNVFGKLLMQVRKELQTFSLTYANPFKG